MYILAVTKQDSVLSTEWLYSDIKQHSRTVLYAQLFRHIHYKFSSCHDAHVPFWIDEMFVYEQHDISNKIYFQAAVTEAGITWIQISSGDHQKFRQRAR